jgi:iron complex outermembrane recepter protein
MAGRLATAIGLAVALSAASARAHDVVPPSPKEQPAAPWPGGRAAAHDVVVPVVVTVTAEGQVESAEIEASVSPDFDHAALHAVRRWTFEPARRDGSPVSARVRAVVRFRGAGTEDAAPTPQVEAPSTPEHDDPGEGAEDVRVAGTSPPRSASEVVRKRDVVMAAPHRTASDVLSIVPGVFVTQHSGEGKAHQIFLRGFDAVHGQDVELWVGGIPVNEVSNIHGQGYADLHFVMPEVIRDVTATPGTYDPRQGDFAVAGSVRMRLGYAEPGGTVKGTVGSFGARRLFLAYHPKDTTEETFAAFESYQTDGFGPNRAAQRASMLAQTTHDLAGDVSLRVLGGVYAGRFDAAGVVPRDDVEQGRLDRFAVLDPKQGGQSTRAQVLTELHADDASSRWSVAPFVVFRALQLRQNFTGFLADAQRGAGGMPASDNTQQVNESVTVGVTASYRKSVRLVSRRDALEIGVYGRHDAIEQAQRRLSSVDDAPIETLVDAAVRGTNIAGYADFALHPLPRVAVRPGMRLDGLAYAAQDQVLASGESVPAQARAAQGAHLGKKATVDWAALAGVHLLASYGEGFRSPQARSLTEGERTVFTEVSSWEVGARYDDGRGLSGSLAAFHTTLTDDLVFDPEAARNERVPGTARKGLAAEITTRAGDSLVLASSATYTHASFTGEDARYAAGDLVPYVPQLVVRSDAMIRRNLARVLGRDLVGRIGGGVDGLMGRPLPYAEMGKNIVLVDATAGLRLEEVDLALDVWNVLDAPFYDGQFVYASSFNRTSTPSLVPQHHVTAGPPRTVFLSLTLYL